MYPGKVVGYTLGKRRWLICIRIKSVLKYICIHLDVYYEVKTYCTPFLTIPCILYNI